MPALALTDNQNLMMTRFKAAMAKMQVLGQDKSLLTDCSDVSHQILSICIG